MKKSFRKILAAALSLLSISSLVGAAACAQKSTEMVAPGNTEITKTAAPTDGSLPTAHSGTENLAYIAHTLDEQTQFHVYTYTLTNASIATQITRGYRDYKDGVLISSDITYSTMVKSGSQTCTVFNEETGDYEVYFRASGEPNAETTAANADWREEPPVYYTKNAYYRTFGLLQNELTNFIINDDSVIECGEVHANPDGTFTQSYVLEPTISTYYYAFGMKTRGGLSGYPSFQSVTMSVTFTDKWLPLIVTMRDVSSVNKGVVVTSTSDSTCEFSYDAVDESHFANYENYFKQYIGSDDLEQGGNLDEAFVLDVTNVLSNGFSKIMDGGAQFELEIDLNRNKYRGYAFVALDLADPLATLEIKLSLGKTLQEQGLFVEYKDGVANAYYGDDFALDINVATLKPVIAEITEWAEELAKTFQALAPDGGSEGGLDLGDDALTGLMNAMTLEDRGSEAVLSLQSDDLLGLGVGIDVRLFFGVDSKSATFRGGVINGISVGGEALDINVVLRSTTAEIISHDKSQTAADLSDYVADAFALISSDLIKVDVKLDGDGEDVNVSALKGLTADVTAYLDIDGVTVGAEAAVSYNLSGNRLSAVMDIWYDYDVTSRGYGKVILTLKELNGTPLSMQVGCDIAELVDAISAMLSLDGAAPEIALDSVTGMINSALTNDFSDLLTEVYADKLQIKLGVNVDTVLNMLGVNAGVKFGSCTLAYNRGEGVYGGNLTAALPAIGFSIGISGAAGEIEKPTGNCLDIVQLIGLVNDAIEQVNGITESRSAGFEIVKDTTYLYLDGLTVNAWGKGEFSWKEGDEYVALDLAFSLAESGLDVTTFKLLYRKNAEGQPLVRLALNEVGIDIYPEDIDAVTAVFSEIYGKISSAFGLSGGSSSGSAKKEESAFDFSQLTSNDKLVSLVLGVLASGDWVDILNDMTLTLDGGVDGAKRSLTLIYAADNAAEVRLSADGKLALFYDVNGRNGFAFGGEISVGAAGGELVRTLDNSFDDIDTVSSEKDGATGFIRLAYNYLFEAVSSITVADILGSDTYTVTFNITGDNCNIKALEGVLVNAEIYVTGEAADRGKLAEADLNIDVAGVVVSLNVITERRSNQTYFYINLRQVLNFKLPDLKVMATQDSLYDTIASLVSIVTETNVLDFVSGLIPSGSDGEADADGAEKLPENKSDTAQIIADILEKILGFDFGEAVIATRIGDETTAVFDLDNIASQLGFESEPLGTVEININHKYHSMKTSGKAYVADSYGVTELKEWISLASYKAEARNYSKFDKSKYVSIEFIPDLLRDAINFATDGNGNIYEMFTLSGTVNVNLVSLVKIELDVSALTLGFGEKTGFYFSLIANLKGSMVTNNTIGLTYQNGYLTIGRNLSTAKPEYKIMTFEYFIDNLFAKGSDSTLNWLLGISNSLWNIVVNSLGDLVAMDSGLTTPENIYLYKAQENAPEQEVSMYDYVSALRVIINGNKSADFGDVSGIESKLGVRDNYYGFELNAGLITDGVLTKLYAAITRSDETGITGLKAYGAIQSYVTFDASFAYSEGLTAENYYVIGNALKAGVSAPSLYNEAVAKAEEAGVTIDFDHFVKMPEKGYDEQFGCFSTADMSHAYSRVLYSHKLTVVYLDGKVEERSVRHGSTVYLYDNSIPVYADGAKAQRVLYSLEEGGGVYGKTIMANGDLKLYQITRNAVTVYVTNGSQEEVINSFVGDYVPTDVEGLDTIEGPFYEDGTPVSAGDIIPEGTAVLRLYGTFVKSEVVVNYVKYTFDKQTKSYIASGKAAGFADKYSVQGETLVLENVIDGYKVTAIASSAFANTDEKPLKNVIVPSNITKVGTNAFLDNKDMVSVVFLADSVYFEGSDEDSSYAFYGCSTSSDGEKTKLEIYYNNSDCATHNLVWTHFSTASVLGIKYYKYIGTDPNTSEWVDYHANGGGALHAAGSWCMLDVRLSGAELVEEIDFAATVNGRVTSGFKSNGAYTQSDADKLAGELTQILSQYRNDVGGDKYVAIVTVEKTGVCTRTLSIEVSLNQPKRITVRSAVAMEYVVGSMVQAVAANEDTGIYAVSDGDYITLYAPKATGYVFLGWAEEANGGLQFVGENVVYSSSAVYYAIWGASKVGQEVKAQVNYSGSALTAPSSGNGKWYDNDWNVVTAISKENTVVYTRAVFTLKVELPYKAGKRSTLHVGDKSSSSSLVSGTSIDLTIYEGVANFTFANNVLTVDDGVNVTVIYANEISGLGKETSTKRAINPSITGAVAITSDLTLTINYA